MKLVESRWLITILDDHSRFVTASQIFSEGTAENAIQLLDRAIHECSKAHADPNRPRKPILQRPTWRINLHTICSGNGITHILGGIGKPTL